MFGFYVAVSRSHARLYLWGMGSSTSSHRFERFFDGSNRYSESVILRIGDLENFL
jgi:hypothetical protein